MKRIESHKELSQIIAGAEGCDPKQMTHVVGRVQVAIAEYLESGAPLGIRLMPVEIVSALDAAMAEADGRPSPCPDGADARTFFVHGLYDELVQQPSNIFETRKFPDGSERYVPLNRAVWKTCLQMVRYSIAQGGRRLKGGGRRR